MSYSNEELRSKRKFQWSNSYIITEGVKKVLGKKCRQRNNIYYGGPMWLAVSSNGKEIAKILEEHSSLSNCEIIESPNLSDFTIDYFINKMEGIELIYNNKPYSQRGELGLIMFMNDFAERIITKHRIDNFDIYICSYLMPTKDCIMARDTTILRGFEF